MTDSESKVSAAKVAAGSSVKASVPKTLSPKAPLPKERDLHALVPPLEAWLGTRLGAKAEVSDFSLPVGAGTSNETIFFTATWVEGQQTKARDLVLRIHPRQEYQLFLRPRFRMQFELLEALSHHNLVRVPTVLWYEEDTDLVGQPFFVMERLRGRVPVSMPVYNVAGWLHDATPHQRRVLWESAVNELTRIHRVPVSTVPFVGEPGSGIPDLAHLLGDHVATLAWSAGHDDHPVLDEVHQWLQDRMPSQTSVGLAWGDARIGNMMFGPDFRIVAVMDWEQASLAGGLTDLGWWLYFDEFHSTSMEAARLEGLGSRQETIDLWREATGQEVLDLLWYEALAGFRVSMFPMLNFRMGRGRPGEASPEDSVFLRQLCRLLDIAPPSARRGP
jgi:aminoglycoside phosphotransferase (APT) family kinase protein